MTTPSSPIVSNTTPNGKPCGAFAPGEAGYVQQLALWDAGFDQFFTQLKAIGIDQTNTVFVFHADENDHYSGSAPTNPACNGVPTPCTYDRTKLGEVTTDLPLLLQQQFLYDWGGSATRGGFSNTDVPYGIDFDTAAHGDMLASTVQLLRTRLPVMLEQAGGTDLAQRLDPALVDRVLVDVDAYAADARVRGAGD